MLYDCRPPDGFEIKSQADKISSGHLKRFDHYPDNLLKCHERLYGKLIEYILREDRYDSEIQI